MSKVDWDQRFYHGRYNKYPFSDVVTFVFRSFSKIEDKSQVKILDLGCGGAHHLMFLAAEGFDYHGVDGSAESVQIAKDRLSAAGFGSDTIVKGYLEELPYPDGMFDAVIDRGAITCNAKSAIPPIVAETRRVLKPGGLFYSTILNVQSSAKDGAEDLGDGDFQNVGARLEGAGLLHFTHVDEIRELFAEFELLSIRTSVVREELETAADRAVDAWSFITVRK